jgi:hypothetical protein
MDTRKVISYISSITQKLAHLYSHLYKDTEISRELNDIISLEKKFQ